MTLVEQVLKYEAGKMTDRAELVTFFQGLITSGLAWRLQGQYGQTAKALIDAGYCQK